MTALLGKPDWRSLPRSQSQSHTAKLPPVRARSTPPMVAEKLKQVQSDLRAAKEKAAAESDPESQKMMTRISSLRDEPDAARQHLKDRLLHRLVAVSTSVEEVKRRLAVCPAVAEEQGANGDRPIHRACLNRSPAAHSIMRAMLDSAPETVSTRGRDNALPLHISCANTNDVKCVKDLIAMYPGAALMRTARGDLPVHHAALNQGPDAVEIVKYALLPHPEAVRITGSGGDLPLHLACAVSNNAAVVRELIVEYAQGLHERNQHGDLPVHRVGLNTRPDAAAILMEVLAETHPRAKGVALFPEAVKERGQGGNTALHIACADSNSVMVVRELIFRYPEAAKLVNDRGDLPAHCAAMNGSEAAPFILKSILAAYDEAINSPGHKGNLPLHYAGRFAPSLESIQELIRKHPDAVYRKNDIGELPAFCACRNKTPAAQEIQEEIFKAYPQAFGEKDKAKLHLQVKSLDDTFFPWNQPKAVQAELRGLLCGTRKAVNKNEGLAAKQTAVPKIHPSSCLMTGRFWVGSV